MTNMGKPKVDKKAYSKPKVTEVRLVAEEAVLGLCMDGLHGTCTLDGTCVSQGHS
jgi:hypothetical protein